MITAKDKKLIRFMITSARATVLFDQCKTDLSLRWCWGQKEPLLVRTECLTQQERDCFGDVKVYLRIGSNYSLGDAEEEEKPKKREDFLDGADETRRIIFAFIEEILVVHGKKKRGGGKRKDRHNGIEAVVDKLQEDNHPVAKTFVEFYQLLKAVETIRKYRGVRLKLPNARIKTDDGLNYYWKFDENLGVVKYHSLPVKVDDQHAGYQHITEPVALRDVPVEGLLALLVGQLDLPASLKLR